MRNNFYCQNICGDVNFSIDEWNKTYMEVKDMSEEIQRLVLDPPPRCEKQCSACLDIVFNTQIKNGLKRIEQDKQK